MGPSSQESLFFTTEVEKGTRPDLTSAGGEGRANSQEALHLPHLLVNKMIHSFFTYWFPRQGHHGIDGLQLGIVLEDLHVVERDSSSRLSEGVDGADGENLLADLGLSEGYPAFEISLVFNRVEIECLISA